MANSPQVGEPIGSARLVHFLLIVSRRGIKMNHKLLGISILLLFSSAVASNSYEIESSKNDETFVINGNVFKAKTYCFGFEEGDKILFVEGSPDGICSSATLYIFRLRKKCEVWCE